MEWMSMHNRLAPTLEHVVPVLFTTESIGEVMALMASSMTNQMAASGIASVSRWRLTQVLSTTHHLFCFTNKTVSSV